MGYAEITQARNGLRKMFGLRTASWFAPCCGAMEMRNFLVGRPTLRNGNQLASVSDTCTVNPIVALFGPL